MPEPSGATDPAADPQLLQLLLGRADRTPCRQLVLDTDWASTPAGAVHTWPGVVRSALSTAMASKFPMLVMAGADLTMVYNDGYAAMLGDRHPAAMGRPLREVWADVWPVIAPMITGVVDDQQGTYAQDLELLMSRNGYEEQTWFTFSYSPLLDETGAVVGVLDTALETTAQVLASRRLELAQHVAAVAGRQHADIAAACSAVLHALAGSPDVQRAGIHLRAEADGSSSPAPLLVDLPPAAEHLLEQSLGEDRSLLVDLPDLWESGATGTAARTVALPLFPAGTPAPVGALVVQTSPQLPLDHAYRVALRLLAVQVATAVGNARVNADAARSVRLLETMAVAFFSLDRHWRFSYLNGPAEEMLGCTRDQALGQVVWDLFPDARDSPIGETYRRTMASGEPATFEGFYPAPLNAWFEIHAWPDAAGLSVFFLDVTERRLAQQRNELLTRVTEDLTGILDAEQAAARLAEAVVPALADWCLVTLVDDEQHRPGRRGLRDLGSWHVDPVLRPAVQRYAATRIPALTKGSLVDQALEIGRPVHVESEATARILDILRPGEAAELVAELAPQSVALLPMSGRGQIIGLLTLFAGAGRAPLTDHELATAMAVADRAGLTLDNARLYREQRSLAEVLQRSLLTPPPEPDHAQVVVRYVPAAHAAQVGGDWYDAFLQPGGATVLAIGDVIGHDSRAAAVMGQIRTMVRTIGALDHEGPATILTRSDAAMATLMVDTAATVALARLEQTTDELEAGTTRLRWSNAGHPPPFVIHPDGRVHSLDHPRPDLLLGVDPGRARQESDVLLPRDSVVVFYTDGLVERRDQDLDHGLHRLQEALTDLAGADLDHLCDELLARMVPGDPDDDIALLAVQLHPQDQPRPAVAGPNVIPPGMPAPAG